MPILAIYKCHYICLSNATVFIEQEKQLSGYKKNIGHGVRTLEHQNAIISVIRLFD